MSIVLYKVEGREITPSEETELKDDKIYIIIDKHAKRAKIWIWSGLKSNKLDRYFAGVSATKIKSSERLYGASVEVVESGTEPENFPVLSKEKIVEPSKIEDIVIEEEIAEEITEEIETPPPVQEEESVEELLKQKILSFMTELKQSLANIVKNIENFIETI